MNAAQFQSLSEMEKLKMLIRYGILVGEIKEKNYRAFTYQVQSFFVKTKYTLETDDLLGIESFTNMNEEDSTRWTNFHTNSLLPKKSSE